MNVKTLLASAMVGLGCLVAGSSTAHAQISQYSNIYNRPTVSPYLNLLSTNQYGISNYQTLVRPQIEERDAIQRNGAQLQALQQQFQQSQQSPAPSSARGGARLGGSITGHTTRFMNYSHYYSFRGR